MRLLTPASAFAALLFGAVVAVPFFPTGDRAAEKHFLAVNITSSKAGVAKVYYDDGSGLSEANSAFHTLPLDDRPVELRLELPPRRLVGMRFDPIDGDGVVTIADPRLVDRRGRTLRELALADFKSANQIQDLRIAEGRLRIAPGAGANDPQLSVQFETPVDFRPPPRNRVWSFTTRAVPVALLVMGALVLVELVPRVRDVARRLNARAAKRPQLTVVLAAAAAAVVSCYPVIFLGRSYVSPNLAGPKLLYEQIPTLPGYTDTRVEDVMGSDIGAIGWHHLPLSMLEHHALFVDGELPLWNRHDLGGAPLLGQGQSMFGDPLHLLPILTNGAAWAWDAKYVLARWLFGAALGLIVWRLTHHRPAALLTALSAAFIGFFIFRTNHPAFFSMCYAPAILLAWIGLRTAAGRRQTVAWVGALVLACVAEINSGTAKEAYMLLIGMNLTGLLLVLCSDTAVVARLRTIAWAATAGVIFVLLTAPVWLTFLDALGQAYTAYNNPVALQILPTLILGLFDELFYRPIHAVERVWNPSANYLVFGGVMFLLATWRRTGPDRARLALALGAGAAFLLAFGIFPPEWIIRVPFLGNVGHIDNTFSCVLIVHLIILAGLGYRTAAARLHGPEARGDIVTATLVGAVPVLAWLALTHTVHREPFGPGTTKKFLNWGEHLNVSDFVWVSLVALNLALVGLTLTWWRVQRRGTWTAASGIFAAACLFVLLWRHGQHGLSNFDRYVYNPAARVDLQAHSPAIDFVKAHAAEPVRTVGLGFNLFPGWSGTYGIESTNGPDAVSSKTYREMIDGAGLVREWDWLVLARVEDLARERAVYDFLNVGYYLDLQRRPETIPAPMTLDAALDLQVYASPSVWPRAFFTDRVATYATAADLGRMIHAGDGRPFAAMQITDAAHRPDLPPEFEGRTVVRATNYQLTTNNTSFTVQAPGPGLVVLHETWFDGDFRVRLNDRPAECLRVNHGFKGVAIPAAGEYRVTFAYWPKRFTLALAMAATGALALAALWWWARRAPQSR